MHARRHRGRPGPRRGRGGRTTTRASIGHRESRSAEFARGRTGCRRREVGRQTRNGAARAEREVPLSAGKRQRRAVGWRRPDRGFAAIGVAGGRTPRVPVPRPSCGIAPSGDAADRRSTDRRSVCASGQAMVSARFSVSCDSSSDSWSGLVSAAGGPTGPGARGASDIEHLGGRSAIRRRPEEAERASAQAGSWSAPATAIIPRITRVIPRRWNRLRLSASIRRTSASTRTDESTQAASRTTSLTPSTTSSSRISDD